MLGCVRSVLVTGARRASARIKVSIDDRVHRAEAERSGPTCDVPVGLAPCRGAARRGAVDRLGALSLQLSLHCWLADGDRAKSPRSGMLYAYSFRIGARDDHYHQQNRRVD